jgi:hypothetical protein|tara:strand:+ start:1712 stop:1936 length:225 start_codon:yes stop_codon:yes gene_type:complete
MSNKDYKALAEAIMTEPEFRPNGFVYKHIQEAKSDSLVSIKSAVDNMSDLYDLERDDIGIISDIILKAFTDKQL